VSEVDAGTTAPHLERRFGLLQATALNMCNMVGVGPFITVPLLMSAMGGPQAILGWAVAMLIVIPDGMIWSELGAAMPGSGGSYTYLRQSFGPQSWGRLMAFLFIWQFVLSGPLEIASGYIGFANYAGYIWHGMKPGHVKLVAAALGLLNIALLYRRIVSIGRLTLAFWIGLLLTIAAVLAVGVLHFHPALAFDVPAGALQLSRHTIGDLAAATSIGIYDFLGYYDVCYIGEEVRNPGRVIPRSILYSILAVALLYVGMNLCLIGSVPWREFVPAESHPIAQFIYSAYMERLVGHRAAVIFTLMILWTTVASVFALLLGYSRIPYAAAKDGCFFPIFGRLHRDGFPHVSLVVIGLIAIGCSFFPLDAVIAMLLTTRILVQFVGQTVGLTLLRRRNPELPRPYRMWLYPLPSLIALAGWLFLFCSADRTAIGVGILALIAGVCAFLLWAGLTRAWPFDAPSEVSP
jgi:amino acid transporter